MTAAPAAGRLAANVVQFARLLRCAGLPVGTDKALAAVEAAAWVGPQRRDDLHAALAATLLGRSDERELFDEAFRLFWRGTPSPRQQLPPVGGPLAARRGADAFSNRLADALRGGAGADAGAAPAPVELDAAASLSPREQLQRRDFESMTLAEVEAAKRALRAMRLPVPRTVTRRFRAHPAGRQLDLRATFRQAARRGGEWIVRRRRQRRTRPLDLVVLCDISGSMARYARMLLHFLHALGGTRSGMHVFVFGTRLTNITRALRQRDVDQALAAVARAVPDWSGGTRIGGCLREFNRRWARRVLSRGAAVLLITDGLDAGEGAELSAQMAQLRACSRSIVWLNPLLRFAGFEPRAGGIRIMLPYVDRFLPAHNLASLDALGQVLGALPAAGAHAFRPATETARWR